eukprot:NODE_28_length_33831_cov_0.361200.p5 type:complete len:598 gc:universal NODE_28_length_33831_cov_0.361200:23334-21541(-)
MSIVDQEALAKAEKKLQQKRDKKDKKNKKKVSKEKKKVALSNEEAYQQYLAQKEDRVMDIMLENVTLNLYGLTVLKETDIKISHQRRYGLIGMNGIGKSTLLHAITVRELDVPFHMKVCYVEQELTESDDTILSVVLKADQVREYLIRREAEINDLIQKSKSSKELELELDDIYDEMDILDIHTAESRAAALLIGLGFQHDQLSWPLDTFSGGWQMRVALAKALFVNPDLLLLDEPTNHLDIPAVAWLANYLNNDFQGSVVVVSHDQSFLDLIATDIFHLFNQKIKSYKGNFTMFEKTRMELTKQQTREYENNERDKAHLQAFVDRFRANAARSAQAQSKLKVIEKMKDVELPEITELDQPVVPYSFEQPEVSEITLIQLKDVTFKYPNVTKNIVQNMDMGIRMNSKTILVGHNGAGKSTILKLLMGVEAPISGDVITNGITKIGYFSQHHVDSFQDMDQNAVQYLSTVKTGQTEQQYRAHLGRFGITGDLALQPLQSLSGGQKSRVSFSALSLQLPNVLIMDEASNHLDIISLKALAYALRDFQGALILVSHDVKFIEIVFSSTTSFKQMFVVEYGKMTEWPNTDIYDYQKSCLEK